jgi:membrane-bound lytic murein transglycosylase B
MSAALLVQHGPAFADAGFKRWVAEFKGTAAGAGISGSTFNRAFAGVDAPIPKCWKRRATSPNSPHRSGTISTTACTRIRSASAARWRRNTSQRSKIEARYGVDRHILLAIWSMESNYGEILKNDKVMRNVVRSLATLAYADKARAKFARTQLLASLKILQRGDIDESHLTGSWAGAMGHTQFIPTSFIAYGVDFDGNGRRDIWNSVPDALATAANLLAKNGWQSARPGATKSPAGRGKKLPGGKMSLAKWQSARRHPRQWQAVQPARHKRRAEGARRPVGARIPGHEEFLRAEGYNNADKYALAVGLLADEIAGYGGLVNDWNRPFTKLTFAEKQELQKRLSMLGYYDGKFDGKIGEGSRGAIKAFQSKAGMSTDGHPSMEVLKSLRSR